MRINNVGIIFNGTEQNINPENIFFSCFLFQSQLSIFLCVLVPHLLVTVCPCNIRGNCKMAAKQLEGMPTIQSAVGILLGTFTVIGKQRE